MVTMRSSKKVIVTVSNDGHEVRVQTAEHGLVLKIDQIEEVVINDPRNREPAPQVEKPVGPCRTCAPEPEDEFNGT